MILNFLTFLVGVLHIQLWFLQVALREYAYIFQFRNTKIKKRIQKDIYVRSYRSTLLATTRVHKCFNDILTPTKDVRMNKQYILIFILTTRAYAQVLTAKSTIFVSYFANCCGIFWRVGSRYLTNNKYVTREKWERNTRLVLQNLSHPYI